MLKEKLDAKGVLIEDADAELAQFACCLSLTGMCVISATQEDFDRF